MKLIPFAGSLRQWRRRRSGYNRLSPQYRRSMKVARFGAGKRSWRLRLAPKLQLLRLVSPVKLLHKLNSFYTNMMLKLATNIGTTNGNNVFGTKRIPNSRDAKMEHSRTEFENRLLFEIYKMTIQKTPEGSRSSRTARKNLDHAATWLAVGGSFARNKETQ